MFDYVLDPKYEFNEERNKARMAIAFLHLEGISETELTLTYIEDKFRFVTHNGAQGCNWQVEDGGLQHLDPQSLDVDTLLTAMYKCRSTSLYVDITASGKFLDKKERIVCLLGINDDGNRQMILKDSSNAGEDFMKKIIRQLDEEFSKTN